MNVFAKIFGAARSAAEELMGLAADVRTARVVFRTAMLSGETILPELPPLPALPELPGDDVIDAPATRRKAVK